MGAHKKVHLRALTKLDSIAKRWQNVHGKLPTENDVNEMFESFVPIQNSILPKYSDLIPGTIEAVKDFRKRGLKIGTTTGYLPDMMAILHREAKIRGYEPDVTVGAGDVAAGRPEPWMCLENARRLGIYPLSSYVKVDDTCPGIEEGLNASMWTIGLAKTGNELGLSAEEIKLVPKEELILRLQKAYRNLAQSGAHYVVDSIAEVPAVLDDINRRLANGEKP